MPEFYCSDSNSSLRWAQLFLFHILSLSCLPVLTVVPLPDTKGSKERGLCPLLPSSGACSTTVLASKALIYCIFQGLLTVISHLMDSCNSQEIIFLAAPGTKELRNWRNHSWFSFLTTGRVAARSGESVWRFTREKLGPIMYPVMLGLQWLIFIHNSQLSGPITSVSPSVAPSATQEAGFKEWSYGTILCTSMQK